MRQYTKKRQTRNAECSDVRKKLLSEVGRCELCGHDPRRVRPGNIAWVLDVHEIANGANREKALDKRYALLIVCRLCHDERLSSRAKWPESRQLAALKRSRPGDFDLAAYNALVGRGAQRITQEEVDQWHA